MSAIGSVFNTSLASLTGTAIAAMGGLYGLDNFAPWISMELNILPGSVPDWIVRALVLAAFYYLGTVFANAVIGRV